MYSQEALAFLLLLSNIHLSSLKHKRLELHQSQSAFSSKAENLILYDKTSMFFMQSLVYQYKRCCSNVALQGLMYRPQHKFAQTLIIPTFIENQFVRDAEHIDRGTFLVFFSYCQKIFCWYLKVTATSSFCMLSNSLLTIITHMALYILSY